VGIIPVTPNTSKENVLYFPATPLALVRSWIRVKSIVSDCIELFKLRVTMLVLMNAWAGFYLASMRYGATSFSPALFHALFGIALVACGSSALNQAIEHTSDARMRRTCRRPLASRRMPVAAGCAVGIATTIFGVAWLALFANLITGALTLITAVVYVAVYTPLKRYTPWATFVGAFPGAMPPLLGWTALSGKIEWPAIALFSILFVWQFPHFMAIAWLYREDYGRAGIRMLPVVEPDGKSTVAQALSYAVLMIPVSILPWYLGVTGPFYLAAALVLGAGYLGSAVRFSRIIPAPDAPHSRLFARELLKSSVIYLPLLLTVMMLDASGR